MRHTKKTKDPSRSNVHHNVLYRTLRVSSRDQVGIWIFGEPGELAVHVAKGRTNTVLRLPSSSVSDGQANLPPLAQVIGRSVSSGPQARILAVPAREKNPGRRAAPWIMIMAITTDTLYPYLTESSAHRTFLSLPPLPFPFFIACSARSARARVQTRCSALRILAESLATDVLFRTSSSKGSAALLRWS